MGNIIDLLLLLCSSLNSDTGKFEIITCFWHVFDEATVKSESMWVNDKSHQNIINMLYLVKGNYSCLISLCSDNCIIAEEINKNFSLLLFFHAVPADVMENNSVSTLDFILIVEICISINLVYSCYRYNMHDFYCSIIGLAFAASVGITLLVLGCALPQFK